MILMPVVVLCSCRRDQSLYHILLRALSNYGGVQAMLGNTLYTSCQDPHFTLFCTHSAPRADNTKGVLVFDENFKNAGSFPLSQGLIPVLESNNKKAVSHLKDTSHIAITCGTGLRDTLSIASLDDMRATISLQRELTSINGDAYEPHDFIAHLSQKTDVYPLLAVCGTLLLCGIKPEDGYYI